MSDPVELVSESDQLPKESKAIKDAVVGVIAALKAKKPLTELIASELGALEAAVSGYAALPGELSSPQEPVLAGLMAGQIIAALRG